MTINLLAWMSLAVVICNLYLLAAQRLPSMIRGVAAQGLLFSCLPLLLPNPADRIHVVVLVVSSALVKGVLIPKYLFRAIRDVRIVRESSPSVGNALSVVYGIVSTALSFYVLRKIPFYSVTISPFHAATAIATACTGLFIIVVRKNVVSQIVGYLVFENAGFILAVSVAAYQPFFIEMGILLDILVGVFIMVAAVHHVHAKHDTLHLRTLERLVH